MKDATVLFVAVLAVLVGGLGGTDPYGQGCIENQCFAVFSQPGDFTSAQKHCKDRNAVLATVRSSTANVLMTSIISGNISGQFWIGLHRSTNCPNQNSHLRGYEWVIKDGESDYENWVPTFDGGCSSPRCVTVSERDGFRWAQESCDARVSGFLCEYNLESGCARLEGEGDAVEYKTHVGFSGNDLLLLPSGAIATITPSGVKYICSTGIWQQGPWSCEIHDGGCEHDCAVDARHQPFCSCPLGFSVNPVNNLTCEVDLDDPCGRYGCAFACLVGSDGAPSCVCDHGFKLAPDGKSCVDFNDCSDERQCPGENFRCVNTVGGFKCECDAGFKMMGGSCVDLDECASAPCEHLCHNTHGSYKCSCYEGYKMDPQDSSKCKLHCGKQECVAECDPNDKYQCYCPDGYVAEEREDHTVCIDLDECANYFCDKGCKNTYGGFVCFCPKGFTLEKEVFCVRNEDEDEDEGSGDAATSPYPPTVTPHEVAPTRRPSAVTTGGLVAIIVCVVIVVVAMVFFCQYIMNQRGKAGGDATSKAPHGEESHSLHAWE
ncbi:thrombomodulin-like [Corythoichthys intestinalis]|uniref:thrombomodulin-like n=1 Tax=Corythoichthys intestinalis TaxID=161448 RepID=UPI0025A68EAF|nr:thrombomodulin-like [Corythoichthys intestinalis]